MRSPDSHAAHTLHPLTPAFEAPVPEAEREAFTANASAYTLGIEPEERPDRPAYDSGVLTVVLASFLLVSLSVRAGGRLWKTFVDDMLTVRTRNNAFDQRTAGEAWMIIAMLIQTCIYEGLLLFSLHQLNGDIITDNTFPLVASLIGIAAALLLFQLAAYRVIGFTFAGDERASGQWIRGFNASQSILGFFLIIPSLGALFYPAAAPWLIGVAGVFYIIGRILSVGKGFKIFHTGTSSLFYFFLYLCAVEITPVILAYTGSLKLCYIVR